ncbi:hypothetical protein ACFWFI_01255 [Streptomyces sp. NPDC060209]
MYDNGAGCKEWLVAPIGSVRSVAFNRSHGWNRLTAYQSTHDILKR